MSQVTQRPSTSSACSERERSTLARFEEALARQGFNGGSIAAHRTAVERFAEYLAPRAVIDGTPGDLGGFVAYLQQLGVSARSLANYEQALRRWIAFAEAEQGNSTARTPPPSLIDDEFAEAAITPVLRAPAEPFGSEATMMFTPPPVAAPASEATMMFTPPPVAAPASEATMMFTPPPVAAPASEATMMFRAPAPASPFDGEATMMMSSRVATAAAPASEATMMFRAPATPSPASEATMMVSAFAPVATPAPAAAARLDVEATIMMPARAATPSPASEATMAFTPPVAAPASSFEAIEAPRPMAYEALDPEPEPPASSATVLMRAAAPVVAEPEAPAPSSELGAWGAAAPASPAAASWNAPAPGGWDSPAPPTPAAESDPHSLFDDGDAPVKVIKTAPLPPQRDVTPMPAALPMPKTQSKAEARSAGIPLSSVSVEESMHVVSAIGDSIVPQPARRVAPVLDAQPQGWSLESRGEKLHGLDLADIRDRVRRGEVRMDDRVRKPGGEWMSVAEHAPLRALLDEVRTGRPRRAQPRTTSFPRLGSVLGGVGAIFACGTAWWLMALIAGWDAAPMALLAGIVGASATRRAAGGPVPGWTSGVAALAPAATLGWAKYLLAQTKAAGVETAASLTSAPSFLNAEERLAVLVGCVVLGTIAGFLLGRRKAN